MDIRYHQCYNKIIACTTQKQLSKVFLEIQGLYGVIDVESYTLLVRDVVIMTFKLEGLIDDSD